MVIVSQWWLREQAQRRRSEAKAATLIRLASSRNQQVKVLHIDERRGETTTLSWRIPPSRVALRL
jgi:hypothetical protein